MAAGARSGRARRIAVVRFRRVLPLLALAVGIAIVARVEGQSRPLVAPAAAAIYQRLLPQISRIKLFDHHAHPWWIYAGGGPAAVWSHIDNGEADFGGGFNFLVGVQHKRGLFAELKLGAGDSPTVKFMVGYAFK